MGFKVYCLFFVKDYLDGSERVSYWKDGVCDLYLRYLVGNLVKVFIVEFF